MTLQTASIFLSAEIVRNLHFCHLIFSVFFFVPSHENKQNANTEQDNLVKLIRRKIHCVFTFVLSCSANHLHFILHITGTSGIDLSVDFQGNQDSY